MPCSPCRCKLSILGVCLAAVCSSLQVATIYLDQFEESFDKTWFAIISLLLNTFLAGIHAFQIGLKNAENKENAEDKKVDVETSDAVIVTLKDHQAPPE